MNIAEATAAARVHHQWLPDRLMLEPGINGDTRKLLQQRGYELSKTPRLLGKLQSIQARDGVLYGSSDYRWPDSSVAIDE
jgi:gamma-glutamyltranspeptidase/glutathione hydrolase